MRLIAALLLAAAAPAAAHVETASSPNDMITLGGVLLVGAAWSLYIFGAWRRPPPRRRAVFVHAGALVVALAAFGSLDTWAQTSVALHMVQHMAFMVVAAPLVALGQPWPQWSAATRGTWHRLYAGLAGLWRRPLAAALLHALAIWTWHTPRLYALAVEHPGWHAVEHLSFLLTAWLFWQAVLHAAPRRRPEALLALLLTLMQTGLLGALLVFAATPLYGPHRTLGDQQLAGLLMWIPGGLAYLAGAGAIVWRTLTPALPVGQR